MENLNVPDDSIQGKMDNDETALVNFDLPDV